MLRSVVTFGYRAFPIGPASIGALIGQVSIRHAMALPVVRSVVLVGRWCHAPNPLESRSTA